MDLRLKGIQEGRLDDCKRVLNYINSMDFTSLEDKEIRTLVMIRELGNGIVNHQRKLATEDDVSWALKMSIEAMAETCAKITDQIIEMSLEDFNEEEKHSLMMILEIARGISSKQGVNAVCRHSDLQLVLKGEEALAVDMSGDVVIQLESGDKVELAVVEHESGVKEGLADGVHEAGDKEGLAVAEHESGYKLAVAEHESGDKEGLDVTEHEFGDKEAGHKSGDKGLAFAEHDGLQDGQIVMEVIKDTQESISWPLNGEITHAWITNLMETFKWFSWNKSLSEFPSVMPFTVVEQLMSNASEILHQEPNCVEIQCDNNSRVVVVGDLHGQYLDLLTIWEGAGLPSEKQLFVFNGNYIDKGLSSLELFLVLLAWKVLLPQSVYLLRGNQEAGDISKLCGFSEEVNCKFPEHGQTVYQKCLEVFAELPLASIIANCVYSTHGGLFRTERIEKRQSSEGKKRRRSKGKRNGKKRQKLYTSLALGSLDELAQVNRFVQVVPAKGSILTDVLWSDPTMEPGLMENAGGEAGLLWGPDCTETFLKQSKLRVIIRSHEGPDARAGRKGLKNMLDGYSTDHEVESGKLYTLFSASDYPQHTSKEYKNKGAFAILKPPHFETLEFVSFVATKRPEVNVLVDENAITSDQEQGLTLMVSLKELNVDVDENAVNSGHEEGSVPMLNLNVGNNGTNSSKEQVSTPIVNMDVDDNVVNSGQDVSTPMASEKSISWSQLPDAAAMSTEADGAADGAVGISTPPSWIVSLADDVNGTELVQISEDSKVKVSPLPPDLEEPHKSNYEYLLNLIGSLKKELKRKDDQLEDYKRKQDSSPAK